MVEIQGYFDHTLVVLQGNFNHALVVLQGNFNHYKDIFNKKIKDWIKLNKENLIRSL